MAKAKGTSRGIIIPTKVSPVWQIGILFPDGKKISKPKCTLNEVFNTYFIGLDKYLDKGLTAEELLNKYRESFSSKGVKIQINYIDSYGHLWKGKVAWPMENKFIEYLNKKLSND
jgi:hypothetical protein